MTNIDLIYLGKGGCCNMTEFNWDNINLSSFYIDNIENKVIADKLFVNLLMEIESG
jgi:hypothetical protein